ncbi:hypothetical protein D6T64_08855 [Cryobacterium melibiosiphilum]|uniref:Uncharacterized protein n=1 Tax=Cryobacterium melibiosiphilum TaxID=995039 RepID=A0A3A5MJ15_9MICO|nr:hypothetical protein [Cryobacterium melibiosiphilum]RJT88881.1 hypothetical protein D6T64_08855 [Cryobacterium melibiosiphilum]
MSRARPVIRVIGELPEAGERVDILHTSSLTAAVLWTVQSMEDETIVSFSPSLPGDRTLVKRFLAAADVVTLTETDAAWLYPGVTVDAVIARLLIPGPALVAAQYANGWALGTSSTVLTLPAVAADRFVAGLVNGLAELWADGLEASDLRDGLGAALLARIGQSAVAGALNRVPDFEVQPAPAA